MATPSSSSKRITMDTDPEALKLSQFSPNTKKPRITTTTPSQTREQLKEELKSELVRELLKEEERKKIRGEVLEEIYANVDKSEKESVRYKTVKDIESGKIVLRKNQLLQQMEKRAVIAVERLIKRREESGKVKKEGVSKEVYEKQVSDAYRKADWEVAKTYKTTVEEVTSISTEMEIPLFKERNQLEKELKKSREELEKVNLEKTALEQSIQEFSSMDQKIVKSLALTNAFRVRDAQVWKALEKEKEENKEKLKNSTSTEKKMLEIEIKNHTLMSQIRELIKEKSELMWQISQVKEELEKERQKTSEIQPTSSTKPHL